MAADTILGVGPEQGLWRTELAAAVTQLQLRLELCPETAELPTQLQPIIELGPELCAAAISYSMSGSPLVTARQIRRLDPVVQIVFLADEEQAAQLRREMGPAPRLGSNWSIASPDRRILARLLQDAVRSTEQRHQSRTTLDRIRHQLSSPPPTESSDYRRLVLSDRYLASILSHAEDAILSTDASGSLLTWNKGASRLLGFSEGDTIGRPLSKLAVGEDEERMKDAIQRVREGHSAARYELRLRRADGNHLHTEAIFAPVRDETQGLLGISTIIRDVSESRRAEEEVRKQREWLRVTLNGIGDAVIATDTQSRITFVNPVAEALTGWSEEEAQGQPLTRVFHILYEPTRQPVEDPALRVLRAGRPVALGKHVILMARDGTERPIDDSAAPITDATGSTIGVVLIFRDVTEQRRVATALKESEEKLRLLADTIPQLAWMARPDGHIEWYNRQWYEYTGAAPGETEGWDWQSMHDPQTLPKVLEGWNASISSGEPFEMVFPLKGADGRFRPFLTRVNPLRGPDDRILYWCGTNTDISEIKVLEEALKESHRRKDEFLATLAHELRNPLAPIRSGLEVMKLVQDDPLTMEEVRSTMERQTQQLTTLVDDLLDVSRITQGKLELRKCRVELTEVVRSAVEAAQPLIDEANHELTVDLPVAALFLDGDPHRLVQVLSNLLNNSAKYTPEGGRIGLTAECQADEVVITVKDNGIGIPAEMQEVIFERFAQIERPLEKNYTGLGLGLTLVKSLVELHGGRIDVQSDGPDQGSAFRVSLPRPVETPANQSESVRPEPIPLKNRQRRVLVVDDNTAAAEMLSMLVKMLGNDVRTANDGKQGVEVAAEFLPDVILMDLGMPRMDGCEAAKQIRQQPWGEKMMLVALTGWGQDEDKRKTREAGFDHHLTKPADPNELQQLIASVTPLGNSDDF